MIFILLSISCNILVAILLKLVKRYEVDVKQAIVWNYSVAMILTWLFFQPDLIRLTSTDLPIALYIALGVLLPSLFVMIAASIRHTGIVRTDIAQRLSLLIPIFAAFIVFSEEISILKIGGIGLGFVAILCTVPWGKRSPGNEKSTGWIYLIVVFFGMGIVDILFKQIAVFKTVPYTSSLFIVYTLAFGLSLTTILVMFLKKSAKFSIKNVLAGIMLGVANFGNILFYLKAHQTEASRPSLVFSTMNIGVIAAGSLVGLWLFNEKLSPLNKGGILLSIISILIITLS